MASGCALNLRLIFNSVNAAVYSELKISCSFEHPCASFTVSTPACLHALHCYTYSSFAVIDVELKFQSQHVAVHHFEDLDVDGRIILKWTLGNWNGKARTGLVWLRIRTSGGLL